MTKFQEIKKILHGDLDLYENFDHTKYGNTLSPGSMPANEILQDIVKRTKPTVIVEIGSWLGWSAVGMAAQMKANDTEGAIICIDTWMGSVDHWNTIINDYQNSPIKRLNGYPTFYYNFLANMVYAGLQNTVIPVAYPSTQAAHIVGPQLKKNNIDIDLIFLDGSHLAQDVYTDCISYYPFLKSGGMIFGDDWQITDVRTAITEYCETEGLPSPELHPNGVHWFMKKT